ncbi:hypothetical protein C8Q74DRAFT_1244643 [Fomes fomentarius]|nr:hypothetical protein C8Q74DRAFT_1244643 [Fomes fomentarius]
MKVAIGELRGSLPSACGTLTAQVQQRLLRAHISYTGAVVLTRLRCTANFTNLHVGHSHPPSEALPEVQSHSQQVGEEKVRSQEL